MPHVTCFLDVTYGVVVPDIVDGAVLVIVVVVVDVVATVVAGCCYWSQCL